MKLHVCLLDVSEIMRVHPTPSNIRLSTNKTTNTFPHPRQSAGYLSVTECTKCVHAEGNSEHSVVQVLSRHRNTLRTH